MTILEGLFLGTVQGLTEFLPVSSSGHLVIFQTLFGLTDTVLSFDIVIHLATLLAIIIFFGRSLFKVTFREWVLVAIGTIPAALFGFIFKDSIDSMFSGDRFVGLELIISGLINFYIDWKLHHPQPAKDEVKLPEEISDSTPKSTKQLTPFGSLMIGVAQAIAIIPAISRSGSTVAGSVAMGLSREEAFRFSFLLAIPAILGAGVLEAKDILKVGMQPVAVGPYVAGAIAAFVFGLASLAVFKYVITKAELKWFGWYCVVAGAITLIFIH